MKKNPTNDSSISIKSKLKDSFNPRRKDNSFTKRMTAKTIEKPYKPSFNGEKIYFFSIK